MSVLATSLKYISSSKIYQDWGAYDTIISKWEVHLSFCNKIYTVTLIKGSEFSKDFEKDFYFQVDDRSISSLRRTTKVEWEKQFTFISFCKEDFQEFEFDLTKVDEKWKKQISNLELKNEEVIIFFKQILEDYLIKYIEENQSFLTDTAPLLSGTVRSSLRVNGDIETKSIWRRFFCCCFS